MKKVFIFSLLIICFIFQFGCSKSSGNNNVNNANANLAEANNNQANAVTVSAEPQVYTDAQTALSDGKKLFDENKFDESINALEQAVKLDPKLAEAHFYLGMNYDQSESNEPSSVVSEDEKQETTTVTRKNEKGKKETVKLTRSEKAFQDAAELYEKVTKEKPEDDLSFYNLGRSYNKLNQDEEAEKALRQAVKLKPDDVDYQIEFGKILTKLSHYDEAVKALKKAQTLDPSNGYVEDLLDKAEAGEKRIDYAVKQKEKELTQKSQGQTQNKNTNPTGRPTPPQKIENVPIIKSTPK